MCILIASTHRVLMQARPTPISWYRCRTVVRATARTVLPWPDATVRAAPPCRAAPGPGGPGGTPGGGPPGRDSRRGVHVRTPARARTAPDRGRPQACSPVTATTRSSSSLGGSLPAAHAGAYRASAGRARWTCRRTPSGLQWRTAAPVYRLCGPPRPTTARSVRRRSHGGSVGGRTGRPVAPARRAPRRSGCRCASR